jgi:hypothetical protein
VTLFATSVNILKPLIIYYSHALLLNVCGQLLQHVWELPTFLPLLTSHGNGVKNGFPMRNKVCFEGKKLHNPLEIVSHACALMKYWAGLHKDVDKEVLIQGVNTMLKIAVQLLAERRADVQINVLPEATREDDAEQESEH